MKKRRRHSLTEVCIVPVLAGAVAVHACSPREVSNLRKEYHAATQMQVDTFWRDRFRFVWEKGDTVTIHDSVTIREFHFRDKTDTLRIHDTTTVTRTEYVEKELSAAQRAEIRAFWWLVAAVAALAAWTFRKPLRRLVTGLMTLLRL